MTDILTKLAALTAKDENGLLPCPFCGDKGQPLIWRKGNEYAKERGCDVGCAECGFTKSIRVIRYSLEWAEQRAVAAWNNRPREAALIALVQEAAAEIERLRKIIPIAYRRGWDKAAYGGLCGDAWKSEDDLKQPISPQEAA